MGRAQGRKGGNGKGALNHGKDGGNNNTAEKRPRDSDVWQLDNRDNTQLSNTLFEQYYTRQEFLKGEGVWDNCYNSFKTALPMATRVNRNHPDRRKIAKMLVDEFKHNGFVYDKDGAVATAAPAAPTAEDTAADATAAPLLLRTLPFVKEGLGFQAPISRGDLKRQSDFKRLKKLIAALNEAGMLTRQETVSMVPPMMLDVQPGMKVLDMCAAPGSKTSQLLEALVAGGYAEASEEKTAAEAASGATDLGLDNYDVTKSRGVVVANDVNIARIDVLTHQTGRAAHSHPNLIITNNDATNYPLFNNAEDKFDRVLCDVMCSGDGTLRKSLDLWSRWNPHQGADLHTSQLRTLLRGMSLVKEGGVVVYSTCSLNPIEDEAVIAEALLQAKGAFELVDPSAEDVNAAVNAEEDSTPAAPANSGNFKTVKRFVPGLRYSPGITQWQLSNKEGTHFFGSFEESCVFRRDVMKDKGFQFRSSMFPPNPNPVPAAPEAVEGATAPLPTPVDHSEAFKAIAESLGEAPTIDCLHLERAMRITPHLQDTGGFFVAALRCKKDFCAVETSARRRYQQEEEAKKNAADAAANGGVRKDLPYVPVAGSSLETTLVNTTDLDPAVFPYDRLFIRREAFFKATGTSADGTSTNDDGYDSDGHKARGPRVAKLFLATEEAKQLMARFPPAINIKQIGIKAFESYSRHTNDKFRVFAESFDTMVPYMIRQQQVNNKNASTTVTNDAFKRSFLVRPKSMADAEWMINLQEKSQGRTVLAEFIKHVEIVALTDNKWSTRAVETVADFKAAVANKSFAVMCPLYNKPEALAAADESQKLLQTSLASLSPLAVAAEIDDSLLYCCIKILPHHLQMMKLALTGSVENPAVAARNGGADAPANPKPRERDGEEEDNESAASPAA